MVPQIVMARKQTKKKIKMSGPPSKHRQGYRGQLEEDTYVLNRTDVLKYDGKVATFYRDGVPIYRKEVLKDEEMKKYVRIITDYGDVVLKKYFESVPIAESPPPTPPSTTPPTVKKEPVN